MKESRIKAAIYEESPLRRLWSAATPMACVRLKVGVSDYEEALRLLRLWDTTEGAMRHATHCPECRSTRVR